MVQEKTQKKVLKVIESLKAGKNLSQALKAGKMTRGHYYSARDAMLRDGDPAVTAFAKPANVVKLAPKEDIKKLHAQALSENDRLKWAEELIEEIKGTQKRQADILKKLMA